MGNREADHDFFGGKLNDDSNDPRRGSWRFPLREIIEKSLFNCGKCGSFFTPDGVFAVLNEGTVCADCVERFHLQGERLKFFDAALQNLPVLPCLHAKAGCKLKLLHEDLNLHLEHCVYRPVRCIHPGCSWENKQSDLVEHFKATHRADVIDQKTVFSLDVGKEAFVVAKLLIKPSDKYFLLIRREQNSNDILYNMFRVPKGNVHDGIVRHFCDDAQDYRKRIQTEPLNMIDKLCALNRAPLTVLKEILEGEKKWSLTVNDTESKEEKLLICSGCRTTMTRPIYQCEAEHGICNVCSTTLSECPVCRKELENITRNVSLEALTCDIFRPCTYRRFGCEEKISLDMLKQHEATCLDRMLFCPLPNCSFKKTNPWKRFDEHILQSHSKLILPTNRYFSKVRAMKTGLQYIYFEDGFFQLNTNIEKVENTRVVSLTLDLLQNRSQDVFKFDSVTRFLCKISIMGRDPSNKITQCFLITKDCKVFRRFHHRIDDDFQINVKLYCIEN